MKEFYIYMAVIIIWASWLTYIGIDKDSVYKSCITLYLVFGLKQLIEIKNNTK